MLDECRQSIYKLKQAKWCEESFVAGVYLLRGAYHSLSERTIFFQENKDSQGLSEKIIEILRE